MKAFVEEWVNTYQPDMGFLVFEEQDSTDIFIRVTSVPKSEQLVLAGQQQKSLNQPTQNRIKDYLYGKKIFKALFDAVSAAARGDDGIDVDITGDNEFLATKLREKASCAVALQSNEITFTANIGWEPTVSARSIAFNISEADASITVPAATRQFSDAAEAAQWVLQCLHRSDAAIA